jgi:glycosyltransferase involved in cell wall biosynthesis
MAPRILLVHEPPDGGVANHVMQLALGLSEHGLSVEVAGPRLSAIRRSLLTAGVPYHEVDLERSYRRPDRDAAAAAQLRRIVRRRGVEIVHSHSSKAGALARLAALGTPARSVYTPHCFGFVGDVSPQRRVAVTAIERVLARSTDAIICVSEAERRRALDRRIAPPSKLHTILNGVPAPHENAQPDPGLAALRRGGPVVGLITVLRAQKRVDVFLEAIPVVWRALPRTRFAVIGGGPLEASLQARAEALGLTGDERFLFAQFTPPSERYLKSFDLFGLTSDWEAMSIGLLEAMACGVPQVVTDVDGCAEAVAGRTGRVVAPGDPRAFAQAVIELLEDPSRRRLMEQASRARYRERFTEDRMINQVAALYRSLLRGSVDAPG